MSLTKFSGLTYEVNDTNIYNDCRVMVPHYDVNYIWNGSEYLAQWLDLVYVSQDGASSNLYGRRTLLQKYHTIAELWSEGFCNFNLARYKDPWPVPTVTVPGLDDETIQQCLETKISDLINILEPLSGINESFWVDGFDLTLDRTQMPIMALKFTQARPFELSHIFILDTDLLDGESVLG